MVYHSVYVPGDTDITWGSFRDLKPAVTQAVRRVERHLDEFDMIVVQGVSGMSIGFPLSVALDKDIVVVRKPNEDNHAGGELLTGSSVDGKRCLFVDDFVSEGYTRKRVREVVEDRGGKVVAQYLSQTNSYESL